MIPPLIIQTAVEKSIDVIAITDHNSSKNVKAVMEASKGSGVHVIPGIELQTKEEIHCICLFDTIDQCESFQQIIDKAMPKLKNDPEVLGEQYIVDATGEFLENEDQLLIVSSSLSLNEAFNQTVNLGGIVIPAHVDRISYGLLPVLGFFPENIDFPLVEISSNLSLDTLSHKYPQLIKRSLLIGGDAHSLDSIIGLNELTISHPCIKEITNAARHFEGRTITTLEKCH